MADQQINGIAGFSNQDGNTPSLDLSKIWDTVMKSTQASTAPNGLLGSEALSNMAQNVLGSILSSAQKNSSNASGALSGINLLAIISQLRGLYDKYIGSSNSTEVAAANNMKQITDIIESFGKGSNNGNLLNVGLDILGKLGASNNGNGAQQGGGSVLGSILGSVLGGNQQQQAPQQQSQGGSVLGSVLGSIFGGKK